MFDNTLSDSAPPMDTGTGKAFPLAVTKLSLRQRVIIIKRFKHKEGDDNALKWKTAGTLHTIGLSQLQDSGFVTTSSGETIASTVLSNLEPAADRRLQVILGRPGESISSAYSVFELLCAVYDCLSSSFTVFLCMLLPAHDRILPPLSSARFTCPWHSSP